MYKSVIIVGPGIQGIFYKLKKNIDEVNGAVLFIGDGESPLLKEKFTVLEGQIDHQTRIDIYIHSNRKCVQDNIFLSLVQGGAQREIPAGELFENLSIVNPSLPLNIHLWSCYGSIARNAFDCLPQGSVLVTHAAPDSMATSAIPEFIKLQSLDENSIVSNYDFISFCSVSYYNKGAKKEFVFSPNINDVLNNPVKSLEEGVSSLALDFPELSNFKASEDQIKNYVIGQAIYSCSPSIEPLVEAINNPDNSHALPKLIQHSLAGFSLLHFACNHDLYNVAEFLLSNNDDPNKAYLDCGITFTPLSCHLMKVAPPIEFLSLLMRYNVSLNDLKYSGQSILHHVAALGYSMSVMLLLAFKAEIDILDNENKSTPLISAVRNGHYDVAKVLLGKGANVNALHNEQLTPLILATFKERSDIVKLLLDYNAAPEIPCDGRNAYYCAWMANGPEDIANMLLGTVLPAYVEEE